MRLLLASPGIDSKERKVVEYELNKALPSIKRRLGRQGNKIHTLRAHFSAVGGDYTLYSLTLSTHIREHAVAVQKVAKDPRTLVSTCESALKKELLRSVSRLRKDHLSRRRRYQKDAFADFSREVSSSSVSIPKMGTSDIAPEANPIFARLRPLLTPLYNHARELIRTSQLAGEIPANYLSPYDLVDQAMVSVADSNGNAMLNAEALEQKLYREIESLLTQEITAHHPGEGHIVSLESPAPEEEERWLMGEPEEDEAEFFQPFEALRMEDVLIDEHAIDPEHALSDIEQHRVILKYLAHFHAKARSAFFLNRVEGFEPFEIAMIQNRSEDQVKADIERCVKALQEGWKKLHHSEKEQHAAAATG